MEGARMARRMFAVVDVVELLRHWQAGDSVSQMARGLGLDRKTVRKYVGRAEAAGHGPGGRAALPGGVGGAGEGLVPGAHRSPGALLRARRDRPLSRLHREAPGRPPPWPPSTSACATSTALR